MKTKWLAVLLVVLLLLIVPIISACSCNNTGDPVDTGTESGNGGTGVLPPNGTDVALPTGTAVPVVKYVRISEIGNDYVTIKFNALGENLTYDIRYSAKEITEANFEKATKIDVNVLGASEVKTAKLDGITAGPDDKVYIAVRVNNGTHNSVVDSVRAGGIEVIEVDTSRVDSIYLGEVIKDATPLFDENDVVGDPYNDDIWRIPENGIDRFYYPGGYAHHNHTVAEDGGHERFGTTIAPIVDLEFNHYVDCVYLYYSTFITEVDYYGKTENEAGVSFDIRNDVTVRWSEHAADFQTPDAWDGEIFLTEEELTDQAWNKIEIGAEARYIQIAFVDGGAPKEVLIYGYQTSENSDSIIGETVHKLPLLGEMMGQCGFVAGGGGNCTIEQLSCTYVVREYHNVGWSYSNSSFPNKSTKLANTVVGNFDTAYAEYSAADLLIIPCLQWNDGSSPARRYDYEEGKLSTTIATWDEKYDPQSYAAIADLLYQYSARYGSSKMGYLLENALIHSDLPSGGTIGRDQIKWIEVGNEPNGEDSAGATPYQLAALQSAAYDGHQRTLLADVYNPNSFSYPFGGKNADPDMKIAMAGLAGIGNRYISSMVYWMRANRTDGCIAMDAFNFHTYFGKTFTMNGQNITVGVSPEEWGLADALRGMLEYRDKYYPDVEVWITEFGWDTNQSYETPTSAHAYGTYEDTPLGRVERSREIQGMWLTRAYIIMSALGMDKATMYMCEDVDTYEVTASGKYGTCGIYYSEYTEDEKKVYIDANGDKCIEITVTGEDGKDTTKWVLLSDRTTPAAEGLKDRSMMAKDAYFMLWALKETLGHMRFERELATGRDDVWVYQYGNEAGDCGYAFWCPTSNDTVVENFKIYVGDVEKATLVEAVYKDILPSQCEEKGRTFTELEVVDGYVTVTATEVPRYIVVE
ncbi:MAG: hypothetical protein IJ309_04370 [Clostridia bacterium]|nr:hypothetical protein [Clostridia bacterium]